MKPEELQAIKARAEKATPGPWEQLSGEWYGEPRNLVQCDECTITEHVYKKSDADFIAHSREDIPALIAEVERLQAENKELRQVIGEFMVNPTTVKTELIVKGE